MLPSYANVGQEGCKRGVAMRDRRSHAWDLFSWFQLGAVSIVGLVLIGYVVLMHSQREHPRFWVLALLGGALVLVVLAARLSGRARARTLVGAASGLLILGVLGIFSIGLPLIVAGGLVLASTGRDVLDDEAADPRCHAGESA